MAAGKCADSSNFWEIEDNQKYSMLLNNVFLSDVTFIIGEECTRVPGHSFVLTLCSWDFYNAFKLVKLDKFELIIKDVPESSFLAFLEYCYTFTLDLTEDKSLDKTMDILKLSQRFHMKTLEQICLKAAASNPSILNCMNIYKNKVLFPTDSSVPNTALHLIGNTLSDVIQIQKNIEYFLDLSLEAVMEIDKKRCTVTSDEKEWFDTLIKWAKRACQKKQIPQSTKNLKMVLGDLFYEIRFPDMKATWFIEINASYPGLFTTEEFNNISRKMNGHTVDCPGFKCLPQLTYNSCSRVVLFGNTLHSFTGPPKLNQGLTDEMTSKFGVTERIELLGFAFMVKRHEMVNVTTCKLNWDDWSYNGSKDNITTNPAGRHQVNENFDLIAIRFDHKCILAPISNYRGVNSDAQAVLHCKFDKPVPNLSSGKIDRTDSIRGTWCRINEQNAIPYLIFSES